MSKRELIEKLTMITIDCNGSQDDDVLKARSVLFSLCGALLSGDIDGLLEATSAVSAGALERINKEFQP